MIWLFDPLPYGVFIGAVIRYLLAFSLLILAARYRRDHAQGRAGLCLVIGFWTLIGGIATPTRVDGGLSLYSLVWLSMIYGLVVTIILRRAAAEEVAHDR